MDLELIPSDAAHQVLDTLPMSLVEVVIPGFVSWSSAQARVHFGAALAKNQRLSRLAAPADAGRLDAWLQAAVLGHAACTEPLEIELHALDGLVPVRVHCIRQHGDDLQLWLENVAASHALKQRATQTKDALEILLDEVPVAAALLDDCSIVRCNDKLALMLEVGNHADLVGQKLQDLCVSEERATLKLQLTDAAHGNGEVESALRFVTRQHRLVAANVRLFRAPIDEQSTTLALFSEQETARDEYLSQEQGVRLSTLGMLVAGVAHEINNPLTFVIPNLDALVGALEGHTGVRPEWLELAQEARVGVRRVAQIVRDLKTFTKVDDTIEPLDLNPIVVDITHLLETKLTGRVTLKRVLGPLSAVAGNSGRVRQVLLNLIMNAVNAMPQRPPHENWVKVRTWLEADEVHLCIDDNGKGIEPAGLSKLFEPFYTTRPSGTGLGLAVCANIVREMGGTITVDSTVGVGSTFHLKFPIAQKIHSWLPASPNAETRPEGSLAGVRVLIVDDEPLVLRTMRRTLSSECQVFLAQSGNRAIELLRSGTEVDVVLTDMVMADGSGDDLLRWIEAERPSLARRCIFMTGMAPGTMSDLQVPRIQKPVDISELRGRLLSVLKQSSSRSTRPPPMNSLVMHVRDGKPEDSDRARAGTNLDRLTANIRRLAY